MLWEQSLIYLFITGVFLIQDDALRTSRHRGDFPTYQFTSNYTHPKTPWHSSSENGRGVIFIQKGSVNRILFPNKFHASFYNIKYLPLYCILLLNVTHPPSPSHISPILYTFLVYYSYMHNVYIYKYKTTTNKWHTFCEHILIHVYNISIHAITWLLLIFFWKQIFLHFHPEVKNIVTISF